MIMTSCPLCGRKTVLNECVVRISLWTAGKTMNLCEDCVRVLRERHMYVTEVSYEDNDNDPIGKVQEGELRVV